MTKELYFNLDPDSADAFGDISDVLKDTIKRFDSLNKTVMKAERQLMKFDEINRLVAYEVKEKSEAAGKSSSGSSAKKSSSSGSSKGKDSGPSEHTGSSKSHEATLPMYFTIKDVLFNWDDLDPEQIMMKIIAGLTALGGGVIGFLAGGMFGGVPGAIIGLGAGLLFGILLDNTVFNFDGELSKEEFWNSLTIALGTIGGGLIGFMAAGPFGIMLGLTIGLVFSMVLTGINWDTILQDMDEFFADLQENFHYRWESFQRLMREKFAGLRNWWNGLNLGRFQFKVPHLTVEWQELASDSVLAKFLGITAIPHLSVQWYPDRRGRGREGSHHSAGEEHRVDPHGGRADCRRARKAGPGRKRQPGQPAGGGKRGSGPALRGSALRPSRSGQPGRHDCECHRLRRPEQPERPGHPRLPRRQAADGCGDEIPETKRESLWITVPRESLPCAPRESLCPSARYCGRYKGVGLVSSSYLLRGR